MILERGAILNNRYRIVEILGQGGMGSVYRAVDENLGVEVAVKDNLFTTDEYARQFRREAVILANLRHPHLPRVTDHFVIEGQGQYLVMDYIEGEDLRQRMDRTGLLSEDDAVTIGAAICDALTYLSTRSPSIVHRDIKPGNVKITPQGQIFLVDFGLAKVLQGTQATTTGARAMTPGYSPPEQYGTARTDQRSDIFSLGATLYAALTGAVPEDALARAMDQTELTPIRKHNPKVSRRLAGVIEKSLAAQPDDRYQTAEEFKQAMLNARGLRRKTGEYSISPPPAVNDRAITPDDIVLTDVQEEPVSSPPNRSPLPMMASTPLEESHPQALPETPRSQGRGCWMVILLLVLLFVGGAGAAMIVDPSLPAKALAYIAPAASTETPLAVVSQEPTATPTVPVATNTANPDVLTGTVVTQEPVIVAPPTETPTPTATETPIPTPTGGGTGEIAFASNRSGKAQIYIANIDGSDLRQITDTVDGACQPAWSPDGHRLVFISPCESNHESYPGAGLFIIDMNAEKPEPMPLTNTPGGDYDPAWSPDGAHIAFTSLRTGDRPQIYVYSLEDRSIEGLSNEYSRDMQPAWSPDGSKIAFITTRNGPYQIWLMDADGQNQTLFSHSKDWINTYPTWSPDGQLILFTQKTKPEAFPRLVVAPLEEGPWREFIINQNPIPMREAQYSPDGFFMAAESWPEGQNHGIYVMTANGADRKSLDSNPANDFDPAWRPKP
jgi:serine/threonine protein kinase